MGKGNSVSDRRCLKAFAVNDARENWLLVLDELFRHQDIQQLLKNLDFILAFKIKNNLGGLKEI